jgi:hypothetical protein
MHFKLSGWVDEETGQSVARVRTLTEPLIEHPEMDGVYRRALEEFIPNEFSLDPDPDTFSRRDLADDESVDEEERAYTYYEMRALTA